MDPILQHHFNNFKSSFDILVDGKSSEEMKKKESKAFEKFVNYLIYSLDDPGIFTGKIDLLDFVCVGGGNDTGVDGIGIRINDKLVCKNEDVTEIAKDSRKLKVEFVFVQSKLTQGFDLGEFSKFCLGVKNFFSDGYLPENPHVKEIRDIKEFIYSDHKIIAKLDNAPKLCVYYVTTGADIKTDQNFVGAKKALDDDLRRGSLYFEDIIIEYIGGKQLIKYCKELENKFEVYLNIQDIFPLIVNMEVKEDIKKSYAFTCRATEFLKILIKEDGQLRRSLFNSNVRDYLGNRGTVNSEIERTIKDDPELFLLCNNGVTIVCTGFDQVRDKLVKIENPQIVNGCQTSNSIFYLKDNKNIDNVQIIVRIISTENLNIANKIVRGTNKQNQVLDEAFEATLPFHQDVLEPFFLSLDRDVKLYYERRAKQYNNDSQIKKTQIVNPRILIQTFVAVFLNLPHEAHLHEAKLLEKYGGDSEKRKIFVANHEPLLYYTCALIWYMFEKFIREEKIAYQYKTYKSHLYYIFRQLTGPLPNSLLESKNIKKYCNNLLTQLEEPNFGKILPKTLALFDKAKETWTSRGKSFYGIKDSKDFTDHLESLLRNNRSNSIEGELDNSDPVPPVYSGRIANIVKRNGIWFGFIDRGTEHDNIYFDKRGYVSDVELLFLNSIVDYQIGNNPQGDMAIKVRLVQ